MQSPCLPLQDSGLSGIFKRHRVHLHLHFKPFQNIIYRFEACFNPSIENSICPGSFGVKSGSASAGTWWMELMLLPLLPRGSSLSLPIFIKSPQADSQWNTDVGLQKSVSDVGVPYSIKQTFLGLTSIKRSCKQDLYSLRPHFLLSAQKETNLLS